MTIEEKEISRGSLSLGRLLFQVCRLAGHRLRSKTEEIGLHRGQGFILFHLLQNEGIAQSVIAHAMHVSPATVTNTLQRMERDGWITRERDSMDQRIVRVRLTSKSMAMREKAEASFAELEKEMTSALTDKERETLSRLLIKVHEHLAPKDDFHYRGPLCGGSEERR